MSVNNGFTFRAPKVPDINSIDHLSFDEFYEVTIASIPLPAFPPRSLMELVKLVDQGMGAEISVLEWLDVVENEHHWMVLSDKQRHDACRAIWLAICTNDILGNIAFFKAGLAVEGMPTTMVKPLLDTMDIVRKVPGLNKFDADRIDWLNAVKDEDWAYLATDCRQHGQSPRNRVKKLMLPNANTYIAKLPTYLVSCTPRSLEVQAEEWLERCFRSFKTSQQKVEFCSALIHRYCDRLYRGEFKQLLEESCLPHCEDSLWYELDDAAKGKLKQIFSISSYFELRAISNKLCDEQCSHLLAIEEQQRNQIRGRTLFWSNYSERFNRIRVLLPLPTYRVLSQKGLNLSQQISSFQGEAENNVEVFIFELERVLVVEVLRGDLGETRFFKNTEWNAKRLFEGDFNSLADIRELPQTEVHDHVLLWQYFCEKMLRTKFRVKPNEGLRQFAGLSKRVGQYSTDKGLPKPDKTKLADREAMLEQWVEMFWRHEFNTTKYGEQSGLKQRSNVYLYKAQVAKQTGNTDNYQLYIKKAANQGNPEGMWLLGSSLLLSANSTQQNRAYGEKWIAKAASEGHLKAKEAVQRFGIEINVNTDRLKAALQEHLSTDYKSGVEANRDLSKLTPEELGSEAERYLESKSEPVNIFNAIVIIKELERRKNRIASDYAIKNRLTAKDILNKLLPKVEVALKDLGLKY